MFVIRIVVLTAALAFMLPSAVARVIDGSAASDSILSLLVDDLDSDGIDVRNGEAPAGPKTGRPVVMDIRNFPARLTSLPEANVFGRYFDVGRDSPRSVLVAVNSERRLFTESEFKKAWAMTDADKRVFVSYSSKDGEIARKLKGALEAKGFAAFLFERPTGGIGASAVETGQYFSSAGNRYIIDTANARNSYAVNIEAVRGGARVLDDGLPIVPPAPPASDECCQLCTYRGPIQLSCGPVMCGPQCAGAI